MEGKPALPKPYSLGVRPDDYAWAFDYIVALERWLSDEAIDRAVFEANNSGPKSKAPVPRKMFVDRAGVERYEDTTEPTGRVWDQDTKQWSGEYAEPADARRA